MVKLSRFDMGHAGTEKFLIIFGRPKSGISTLILDYLDYNLDLPIGMVFPGNNRDVYHNKVPELFLHPEVTEPLLKAFTTRQVKASKRALEKVNEDPRGFIILDGVVTNELQKSDRQLYHLIHYYQRLNVTIILGIDHPEEVDSATLSRADYIFIFGYENATYLKKVHKLISRLHDISYDVFAKCVECLTSHYACLVINNRRQCAPIEETIFWYKADIDRLRHFRICRPEYWVMDAKQHQIQSKSE